MHQARDALRSDTQVEADAAERIQIGREISKDYGTFKLRPMPKDEAEVAHRCRTLDKIVKCRSDPGMYTALQQSWAQATSGKIDAKRFIQEVYELYGELWSSSYMLAELICVIPHSNLRLGMLKYILVDRKKELARGQEQFMR